MSNAATLLNTLDLLTRLKDVLSDIAHPTYEGSKLFEVVAFHEDKDLAEALQNLIITKQRVCLIVPSGDRFNNDKDARVVKSHRLTGVDLVMADRAYTRGGQDAAFGGEKNIGVVAMKEIVLQVLAENPTLEAGDPKAPLSWCALYPTDGAFVSFSADEAKQMPGRQAYVLNYETPSGLVTMTLDDARLVRAPFP